MASVAIPIPSKNPQGAALDYTERSLGRHIREQPLNQSVGITVQQLVENNADRVELVITNLGANNAVVWIDSTVSATVGLPLPAGGGFITLKLIDDFTLITRQWFAISVTAPTTISTLELIAISTGL